MRAISVYDIFELISGDDANIPWGYLPLAVAEQVSETLDILDEIVAAV